MFVVSAASRCCPCTLAFKRCVSSTLRASLSLLFAFVVVGVHVKLREKRPAGTGLAKFIVNLPQLEEEHAEEHGAVSRRSVVPFPLSPFLSPLPFALPSALPLLWAGGIAPIGTAAAVGEPAFFVSLPPPQPPGCAALSCSVSRQTAPKEKETKTKKKKNYVLFI